MVKKFIIVIFVLTLVIASAVHAANYGKISGKVVDKENGEPLPGANVVIEGTRMGAATDMDGEYVIIQVPPGTYTVRANVIGYTPTRIKDVNVRANRISYCNFSLSPTVLETQEVVVFAEKPIVEKDMTATLRSVSAENIESMPSTTINDVLDTQPGVIRSGGMHLRGGRSGEVTYMVDGIPLKNPLFSEINSSEILNKNVVSEMQLISGTYSAEYGNAMSGIINITTRGGGSRFHGKLDAKSSRLGMEPNSVENNRKVILGNLSGPLLSDKTTFFLSGEFDDRDNYLPWGYRTEGNVFAKVTDQHVRDLKLSFAANLSRGIHKNYTHSYKYIPEMWWYEPRSNSQMYRLNVTHTLSPKAYYMLSLYHTSYHYDSGDYDYHDLKVDYAYDKNHEFYTKNFVNTYSNNDQRTFGIKGDIVWQANNYNEIKAGFLAKRHNIDRFYITSPYDDEHTLDDYVVEPYEAAGYIQDKINFSSIILNVGLRYDLHAPNTDYWENPYEVDGVGDDVANMRKESAKIHTQLSPRLGISYPVTDKTVFHFGYGHYFQRPEYQFIYKGLVTYDKDTAAVQVPPNQKPKLYDVDEDGDIDYKDNILMNLLGGGGRFGDPNLKPEKTIAYEFGISQQLFKDYVLDVTVYSKQITNLLGARTHFAGERPQYWETFTLHINEDFAYNNGFEVQLRKIRGKHLTGEINYTYAVAEGSSSGPLERVGSELENRQTLKFFPLDFDQRHTVNGQLGFRYGNFRSTLVGNWGSGLPYTIEMRAATDPYELNNGRMPTTWSLDVKMDYAFDVEKFQLIPYIEIYNLTDRRNVVYVYSRTGEPDDSASGKTHEYDSNPENWGHPRLIYLGINLTF